MKFLFALVGISIIVSSCRQDKPEGQLHLALNKNGYYEITEKAENELFAQDGEYILYSLLTLDNNGTVFFDRRSDDMLMREHVRNDSFTLKNLSPVSELIRILSKGDSAILRIPLSKAEKTDELAGSDTLIFHIMLKDILTEKQVIDALRSRFENDKEHNSRESNKYLEAREQMLNFIDRLDKDSYDVEPMMTPGGIKYYILEQGAGRSPVRGQKVRFDFIAILKKNKKEIDNSYNREQSAELIVGARQEIPGLDESVLVMNKNMTAIFFIPSEQAYGRSGKTGVVPPDSDLIYFIRLIEIIN